MDPERFEGLAHRLADAAAAVTLPLFRSPLAVDDKNAGGVFDPVTEADRGAERAIRRILAEEVPDHGFIGEETGAAPGAGEFEWVIDPVDGTRSFMAGVPLWTTVVGLRVHGRAWLGLVDQPYIGERFWGGPRGAFHRRPGGATHALSTRPCAGLAEATLMTTSPTLFSPGFEQERFDALEPRVRLSRYGADMYAYCLLAAGHIDLIVEAGLKPYDIVGLIPVVEAAGGIVTTWEGGDAGDGGAIVAAGDARLHEAALDILRP